MTDRERKSVLRAALILGGAALVRFLVFSPGPAEPVLEGRPSIADSLLAAGDSAMEERERRSRPLAAGETIDPNVAAAEELDRLPGVGPSRALRIVREREENGPFASVEDLTRVSGIGPASVERLRPHLRVEGGRAHVLAAGSGGRVEGTGSPARASRNGPAGAPGRLVDLNRATVEELLTLPGIGPVIAERIVAFRNEHGGFVRPEDLKQVTGVGVKTFERIAPLVKTR